MIVWLIFILRFSDCLNACAGSGGPPSAPEATPGSAQGNTAGALFISLSCVSVWVCLCLCVCVREWPCAVGSHKATPQVLVCVFYVFKSFVFCACVLLMNKWLCRLHECCLHDHSFTTTYCLQSIFHNHFSIYFSISVHYICSDLSQALPLVCFTLTTLKNHHNRAGRPARQPHAEASFFKPFIVRSTLLILFTHTGADQPDNLTPEAGTEGAGTPGVWFDYIIIFYYIL